MFARHKQSLAFLFIVLLLVALAAPPALAAEQNVYTEPPGTEASAGAMIFDLIVVRPLGIVATAFGTAIFIVSLPFSALGGNTAEVGHTLVVEPAKFTFVRPLGQVKP
jgi:hypothetical protein